MCVAVPALVKEIKNDRAVVDLGGVSMEISIVFTPEVKVGNYVIVHSGYSITIMAEEEAKETLEILNPSI
ncbi:MAG: HypC/HybG/HupF family hydrogenase formation chaperone [bacterium]